MFLQLVTVHHMLRVHCATMKSGILMEERMRHEWRNVMNFPSFRFHFISPQGIARRWYWFHLLLLLWNQFQTSVVLLLITENFKTMSFPISGHELHSRRSLACSPGNWSLQNFKLVNFHFLAFGERLWIVFPHLFSLNSLLWIARYCFCAIVWL